MGLVKILCMPKCDNIMTKLADKFSFLFVVIVGFMVLVLVGINQAPPLPLQGGAWCFSDYHSLPPNY